MATNKEPNRYSRLLEAIFARHYQEGIGEIPFERVEINQVADELGIKIPKNLAIPSPIS